MSGFTRRPYADVALRGIAKWLVVLALVGEAAVFSKEINEADEVGEKRDGRYQAAALDHDENRNSKRERQRECDCKCLEKLHRRSVAGFAAQASLINK